MRVESQAVNGILEEFRLDFLDCWRRLPNRTLFFIILVAWLALFHFVGNSTMGYIRTPSLLWPPIFSLLAENAAASAASEIFCLGF